ncbi:hypothetical protein [Pseudomonas carnis]|uniref:hypothetical protein n=1 Tax=Pseudomonas carnis TaxID=2487355 RepID=UPI001E44C918|nr:hypothetical protein [Pseudomonas carnis]
MENEIQELNLQLRKAREDIYGLVHMLANTENDKRQFQEYLAERGAEAAAMRKQIDVLMTSARADKRKAERLQENARRPYVALKDRRQAQISD